MYIYIYMYMYIYIHIYIYIYMYCVDLVGFEAHPSRHSVSLTGEGGSLSTDNLSVG